MLRIFSRSAIILAGIFIAGCGNDVAPPINGRDDTFDRHHIHYGSEHLQNSTAVGSATSTRDPAGILHVQVPLRSTVNDSIPIVAHCTFFRAGQVVDDLTNPVFYLHGNDYHMVLFNSTSAADDFSVSLAEAE